MLDTTTDAGGRAKRRLREDELAWMTTVPNDGQPRRCPCGSYGTANGS
jgi:hypothetical protein